jgi:phytoene dehydrogenase-like protein
MAHNVRLDGVRRNDAFLVQALANGYQPRPAALEACNPNYVGGDINGGSADLRQLFARPVPHPTPYKTPLDGVYLGWSSTPPGAGMHGMCGYHAARAALRKG